MVDFSPIWMMTKPLGFSNGGYINTHCFNGGFPSQGVGLVGLMLNLTILPAHDAGWQIKEFSSWNTKNV